MSTGHCPDEKADKCRRDDDESWVKALPDLVWWNRQDDSEEYHIVEEEANEVLGGDIGRGWQCVSHVVELWDNGSNDDGKSLSAKVRLHTRLTND